MNSFFNVLLSLVLFALTTQAQPANDADVAAVRKVIVGQIDAFYAKDRDQWVNHWVHEPYVSWNSQQGDNLIRTQAGWEAISGMFEGYFRDATLLTNTKVQIENFQATVLDKVATATFVTKHQWTDGTESKTRSVRVLEKQGADWKVAYAYNRFME